MHARSFVHKIATGVCSKQTHRGPAGLLVGTLRPVRGGGWCRWLGGV